MFENIWRNARKVLSKHYPIEHSEKFFCIFYTNFFCTKIFVFFTAKFLHFLQQNFYIFYTKIFTFLHQNFSIFYTKFFFYKKNTIFLHIQTQLNSHSIFPKNSMLVRLNISKIYKTLRPNICWIIFSLGQKKWNPETKNV